MTTARARDVAHPKPLPLAPEVEIPETVGYRIKQRLLGPPLDTEALETERLGIPTALAVFSSDCISSSAYATEAILATLIPAIGVAAFSLVVPLTLGMIVVLVFLILSYRQTIKAYPSAGGAYVVTKDNFGLKTAQVAGVSLLVDYVLTVAVSTAAGTAALASAFPVFEPYKLEITLAFIAIIAYGNLRGVRESGKLFSAPTYLFMAMMALMILMGIIKSAFGGLQMQSIHRAGAITIGSPGDGLLYGAGLFLVAKAFALGGTAMTGVEAISNGVSAFKRPEWKHARIALVIMGVTLGSFFLGLSFLSTKIHPVPFATGTPTVISQIGKEVFGGGALGHTLFLVLQAGTMLILVMAANTSFADFPRLASFHAADDFLPRQLTKRGQRLVYSNGIVTLAIAAAVLVLVTDATVDRLLAMYAIGVFTSFTLSQSGMTKHHWTQREPGWQRGLVINGIGAVMSGVVDFIFCVTKFHEGAWVVVVFIPVFVGVLIRLNKQYARQDAELERDAQEAMTAPILRRHVVLVFVNRLDRSTARSIQYARALMPDEVRAVHVAVDRRSAHELADDWQRLGLSRVPLELVDCPTRRVARSALEVVAAEQGNGDTEVTVLLPHRVYRHIWHRLFHDQTGEEIARMVGTLDHVNVTTVPFHMVDSSLPAGVSADATPATAPNGHRGSPPGAPA